jgi:hypothetical protein
MTPEAPLPAYYREPRPPRQAPVGAVRDAAAGDPCAEAVAGGQDSPLLELNLARERRAALVRGGDQNSLSLARSGCP